MDDLAAMGRLVEALRPWLPDLVVVGGWAHRLHRLCPEGRPPAHPPLATLDADLAFSGQARLAGDMGAALRAADFSEELSGEHVPPVTQYRLGGENEGFYVEFLAPLTGTGVRRSGVPDATLSKAGVTAQKLRHVDVLLVRPWTVRLDPAAGFPLRAPADVRLANPVSYLAQKLLIQRHRPAAKQAQDALYVHDTLELFAPSLAVLRDLWRGEVRAALSPRTAMEVERIASERFATLTDVVRNAARIPPERSLAPERMRAACAFGLNAIFGSS